jgi:hypothetical protein
VLSGGGWNEALRCVVFRVTPFPFGSMGDPSRGSVDVAGDGRVVMIFGGARGVEGTMFAGRADLLSSSSKTSPYLPLGAGIVISGAERDDDDPCLSLDPPLCIALAWGT